MLIDSLNRLEVPMAEISGPEEIFEVLEGKLSLDEIAKWVFIFQMRRRVSESDADFIEKYGKRLGFSRITYQRYKRLFKDVGINVKNLGEMSLKGIKRELKDRCEVWEESEVSLNGKKVDLEPVKAKEFLSYCKV
jgi:hypothetical protein